MPNTSLISYSLSEIAQILGVDEKQLHRYAHKGLLDPALSNDATARFTELDCARLKIIKRADELGYAPDSIFNLIGEPNEVLKVEDPISACQRFAMEKYKQIYDELGRCEALEQLNKQCDLRLITSYIKHLKNLKKDVGRKNQHPKAELKSNPMPTAKSSRARPKEAKQDSSSSPRIESYPAAKLWEYFNKADQFQEEEPPKPQRIGVEPQNKRLPTAKGGQRIPGVPETASQKPPSDWHSADSPKRFKSEAQEIWRGFGEPARGAWIIVGIAIVFVAIGYFLLFGGSDKITQMLVAEKQPAEQQLSETGAQRDQDSTAQTPDKSVSHSASPPEKRADSRADQKTAPIIATGEQSPEPVPPAGIKGPDTPAAVKLEDVSLWHDALDNIYRADLTILNNKVENDREPITGYAFVYLEFTDDSSNRMGLLLPRGEIQSGRPAQVREGFRFSIRNLIQMRLTAVSTLSPKDLTAGKVIVFSPEGDLLLEKFFDVPIHPFFSASDEHPVPPETKKETKKETYKETYKESSISPTEAAFAQLEAQRRAELKPQPNDLTEQSMTSRIGNPQTPPVVQEQQRPGSQTALAGDRESIIDTKTPLPEEIQSGSGTQAHPPSRTEVVAGTQALPQVSEEDLRPAPKVRTTAIPRKTGDPEAAVWDQRSYNAAVQGDFDQAIADATKAIELDPGRINPYINRSWAYIEKNMLGKAIADCMIALSLDPKNSFAYNNRGLAYHQKSQIQKAKDDYFRACELGLELGCQNYNGIVNQSRIAELIDKSQRAFAAKDWDGVIRATTEVIKLDPKNAVAFTNRSAAYANKNYLNKALKDSNEAIKYNPDFSLAYNNRGFVFELLGNNKKAAADYLKSCSLALDLGCKNYERLNETQ